MGRSQTKAKQNKANIFKILPVCGYAFCEFTVIHMDVVSGGQCFVFPNLFT